MPESVASHETTPARRRTWYRLIIGFFLGFIVLIPAGCSPAAAPFDRSDTLTIGAYSVVREALHDGVLPAFREHWKAKTGRDVRFEESYNASGAQARAIATGFDADVALLSLEGDMNLLVKAGIVAKDWDKGPYKGMVTNSLVVIGVRDGNPKAVSEWSDLAKPGVAVLYPDPKSSGGARWNINAIYGSALLASDMNTSSAVEFLSRVQKNVVNMDSSGRQSMATFDRGTGDAVVTYENELLLQRKLGRGAAPYVVPPSTLLIESPVAVVDTSVERHKNRDLAEAFVAYLLSPEGQKVLVHYGFRPLDMSLDAPDRSALPDRLFTMKDLGGWSKIKKEVYEPGGVWDSLFTHNGSTVVGK